MLVLKDGLSQSEAKCSTKLTIWARLLRILGSIKVSDKIAQRWQKDNWNLI